MTAEQAAALALRALAYVLSAPREQRAFLATTGIDPPAMRSQADDPVFLGGVLDFLLADEARLLRFCAAEELPPELPMAARAALPGAPQPDD